MKKTITILMAAVFSIACVSPAIAGRVMDRQVRQQKRIHQGIHSGELTGQEIRGLEKEQRHIRRSKKKAWSDGKLTPKERLRLERQQNKASGHIYKLKHNDINR